MSQKLVVGISDWKIGRGDDTLITYALGSCVGICIYDQKTGLAGLSHVLLPDSSSIIGGRETRMKFADTAIPDMVAEMQRMGVGGRLTAKIAGGAVMFAAASAQFNIGERNVAAVKKALSALRIPIVAEDTGLNYGRTMTFFAQDGSVEINSMIKGKSML